METSGKIAPLFDKDAFLRKTWITLAREDAPIEIFNTGSVEVVTEEKRVFFNAISYSTRWEGEIGNDREESYTDYETYYEKIPYTDYVRKCDPNTKQWYDAPVTKYRDEKRQRAVTRTRTVTDWHYSKGSHSGTDSDFVCIDGSIDKDRFSEEYDSEYVKTLSSAELAAESDMKITDSMYSQIKPLHDAAIYVDVLKSLPGDRNRGITHSIEEYCNTDSALIKVPENFANITFEGAKYTKQAFPFGEMTLDGDKIENDHGLIAKKRELDKKRENAVNNQEEETEKNILRAAAPISFAAMGLLVLSIVVSIFVKVFALVIAGFALSVAGFVLSKILTNIVIAKENRKASNFAEMKQKQMEREYSTFEKEYRAKVLAELNKKLASLGYDPATSSEYSV